MALQALLRDSKGGTAIEYGLVAALIAVAAIAAIQNVGNGVRKALANAANSMVAT